MMFPINMAMIGILSQTIQVGTAKLELVMVTISRASQASHNSIIPRKDIRLHGVRNIKSMA